MFLTKLVAGRVLHGCEPCLPGHLPSGQSQPRARQQRRLVRRLCHGLAMIAGPRFGDYQAGFRFGQLGYDLVEQRG